MDKSSSKCIPKSFRIELAADSDNCEVLVEDFFSVAGFSCSIAGFFFLAVGFFFLAVGFFFLAVGSFRSLENRENSTYSLIIP